MKKIKENEEKAEVAVSKLDNLDQVDGKDRDSSTLASSGNRSLDSLLGEFQFNPYREIRTESQYEVFLAELNVTDLHRHAEKVGLVPTVEKRVLKERLLREFRKFMASREPVSESLLSSHINQDSSGGDLSDAARRILREGA